MEAEAAGGEESGGDGMSTATRKTTEWKYTDLSGMTDEEKAEHRKALWRDSARRVKKRGGTCDCGNYATVESASGWACDRCLRIERTYTDWQHRGRWGVEAVTVEEEVSQ